MVVIIINKSGFEKKIKKERKSGFWSAVISVDSHGLGIRNHCDWRLTSKSTFSLPKLLMLHPG